MHRLVIVRTFFTSASSLFGVPISLHFSECQTGYVNSYLCDSFGEHVRPYGLTHARHAGQNQQPDTGSGCVANIVYPISGDTTGTGFISLNAVFVRTEISFSEFGNSLLQFRSDKLDDPLAERFSRVS